MTRVTAWCGWFVALLAEMQLGFRYRDPIAFVILAFMAVVLFCAWMDWREGHDGPA